MQDAQNAWIGYFTHTKLKHKSKIKSKMAHIKKCKMHKMHELDILLTKLKHKSKIKTKTTHIKKSKMHKMHKDMTFNAWRVQQRSKELDQGPKEQKRNRRNPSSSKQNDCLKWVSHEKWDEGWKNKNRRCI